MQLRNVNLNLLPVLLALLKTRSVSRAAEMIGMSQAAASNALARLRDTFDDPLLVRVGTRMELTRRALDMIAAVEEQCSGLEMLFSSPRFVPVSTDRTFVVACADYATFLLSNALITAVAEVAPNVRLRFVDVHDHFTERMAEHEVDLAIIPERHLEYSASGRLRFLPLTRERKVIVFRRHHPLARREIVRLEDLSPYKAVLFHPSSDVIERRTRAHIVGTAQLNGIAYVPNVTMAPFIIADTDYYAIVPEHIARRITKILPLEMRFSDFDTEDLVVGLAWNKLHDADLSHRWFREMVQRASAEAIGQA